MFRSSICPYFWVKCEMQLECSIFFSMPQKENCVIFFQLHHPIHLYVLLCDGGTTFRNFPVFRFVFVSSSPVCLPARISYVQECVFDDFRGKVCGVVIVAGLWSDVLWLRSILYSALVVCFCFCVFAVLFYTQNGR